LAGVRVVEVATHVFVPMAGALLAEWGAEVIKVEHPGTGDPYRGLVESGLHPLIDGVDPYFQSANRSKRSVGIDLSVPEGRAVLGRLLAEADVFTTSLRPAARTRLRIDVDDVRADNPDVVYVRGTAFGTRGPDADRGGYDTTAFWARSGMQHLFTDPDDEWPAPTRPAFGDLVAALGLAGAVGTALYRRATTGEASVVDSSLLGTALWQVQHDVISPMGRPGRSQAGNPLMLPYRTADGRFVALTVLSPDRHWADLRQRLGLPDDPRFADLEARRANAAACVGALEAAFAAQPLAHWVDALADFGGEWSVVQHPAELPDDPQVRANGLLAEVGPLPMAASPVQFDESPNPPQRAPEVGEHTEEVLLALGLSWDELGALKAAGAIT
jgi:crotonobetainyl-CoA:carnitine CoA-transferase CaiB-like acyl-CoA transferase